MVVEVLLVEEAAAPSARQAHGVPWWVMAGRMQAVFEGSKNGLMPPYSGRTSRASRLSAKCRPLGLTRLRKCLFVWLMEIKVIGSK